MRHTAYRYVKKDAIAAIDQPFLVATKIPSICSAWRDQSKCNPFKKSTKQSRFHDDYISCFCFFCEHANPQIALGLFQKQNALCKMESGKKLKPKGKS